jgi:3-deoxy-D-arabino-heptulosonate 7-phosphate (DAHP) synthase
VAHADMLQVGARNMYNTELLKALGRRDIVLPCARTVLAAGADGLMVEVHPNPDRALSDGFQQLDLADFGSLMEALGLAAPAKGGVPTSVLDTTPPAVRHPSLTHPDVPAH